ncbi:alpha/beta hydrolase [Sporichthya sp.]|uniref:alpha/beta hydrolase n=1 Tax=Sporichthya sp. TaxID=65475 RepID=UPI0018206408|nr:alpha/beta hydrolase [Sporichthya sp.]MBA3742323.1 alpha/beta fold hydrolase [Sporichthya sp.]
MKRLIVPGLVATTGLVAASLLTLGAAPQARAASTIDWVSCEKLAMGGGGTECGYLTVPQSWSDPNGTKIKLAISRNKSTLPAAKYQGVMLVNPGGPGGSGLSFSGIKDLLPNGSGAGYDWIGFDPRGVGDSKPALSCIDDYAEGKRPPYIPAKRGKVVTSSEKSWLKRSKKYAKACAAKYGPLLQNMRTVDWVKDMDALREALGVSQINYLGFSYGTYLGQVYATMYPTRVRRMIFDGNVDPRGVWYQAQLSQDRAFEKVANQFFAWTAKNNSTYNLGTKASAVRAKYLAVVKELRSKRVDGIGANEWTDTFVHAMYAEFLWPDAAHAFASWVLKHDMSSAKAAFRDASEPDDNVFAVYNAVQCTDTAWPADYKTWRKDAFKTAKNAPVLTWSNVWFNTACIYWPGNPGKPVTVNGSAAPPILLLNATLDGATPYAGALEVRKRFPKSVLVAEQDATTHAGATLGGNPCIDKRISDYLLSGKLPARKSGSTADVMCARTALPEPGLLPINSTGVTLPHVASAPGSLPAPDPQPQDQSLFDKIVGLLPARTR